MSDAIALFVIRVIVIFIDVLVTLVTFGWVKGLLYQLSGTPMRSLPVKDDPSHRVHVDHQGKKLLASPSDDVETLYDMAKISFTRYADRPCTSERIFLGWKVHNKVKEFSTTTIKTLTYREVSVMAYQFGSALRKVSGMMPADKNTTLDKVKLPCRLAIFENTCPTWMIACIGAFTQSLTVVTVYATLGMDAVIEAVQDNIIPAILCNKKDVNKLVDRIKEMPTLKTIIYTNDLVAPNDDIELPKSPPKGVTIASFEAFCKMGDTAAFPPTPPSPDSCAVVMYTSGSTGKPKGVLITHKQVVGACASFKATIPFDETNGDVYLAYLPAAHIMELLAEFTNMMMGNQLVFADPKSLTTSGAYPIGALEQYQPTMMVAVPKIWDVIKKGVQAKIDKASPVLKLLSQAAFDWRMFLQSHGFDISPVLKTLAFKKIGKATGGRLRAGLSGGGPLNDDVQKYCRAAFGIILGQGYGLTETCACLSIQDEGDLRGGIAGVPSPSCEVKMLSTPEICDKAGQPYLSTDRHDVEGEPIFGRGEICIRGYNVATGYYMMPDKTKEVFDDDGWFHTGDIGQFMSDGSIRIVDRVKNLVKLKGGEYIALEKMEMTYGNSPFVDAIAGGILCYGDGDMDRPIAMMQLSEVATMKWAKENKVDGDFNTIRTSDALYNAVMDDFMKEHKNSDLSHLEKLVGVRFLKVPWTPENGCLTAANKLQRRAVVQMFTEEFDDVKKKGIFK